MKLIAVTALQWILGISELLIVTKCVMFCSRHSSDSLCPLLFTLFVFSRIIDDIENTDRICLVPDNLHAKATAFWFGQHCHLPCSRTPADGGGAVGDGSGKENSSDCGCLHSRSSTMFEETVSVYR